MSRGALKDDYTLPYTIRDLPPRVLRELNDRFQRLGEALAKVQGTGERTPTFDNSADMQRFRIKNAADSQDDGDYVTRRELKRYAGYINEQGEHVFEGTIVAPKMVSREKARNSRTVIRRGQAEDATSHNNSVNNVVAGAWVAALVPLTGTSGTLAYTPIAPNTTICVLETSNLVLGWADSAPGTNKFTISGTTISVNAVRADVTLKVYYRIASVAMHAEMLSGLGAYPTQQAQLTYFPSNPALTNIIWVPANLALRYKSGGSPDVNEFSINNKIVTFSRTLTADGQALAHYPIG